MSTIGRIRREIGRLGASRDLDPTPEERHHMAHRGRPFDKREAVEALLTNIEMSAEAARNERGKALRENLEAIAAWAVALLEDMAKTPLTDPGPNASDEEIEDHIGAVSREDVLTRALGIALDYAPENPNGDAREALALARGVHAAAMAGKLNNIAKAETAKLVREYRKEARGARP